MTTTDSSAMQPSPVEQVAFEWQLDPDIDEEAAQKITDAVRQDGGKALLLPRPEGFLPVVFPLVILGVVLAVALVEQVADWWTNRQKSGVFIQVAKDGRVDIRPANIPYGQVLFVGADGKRLIYVNVSQDQMKDLVTAASRGVTPSGGSPV